MSSPEILLHPDQDSLASAVAAALVNAIEEAQRRHGSAGIVLTGGTVGIEALRHLRRREADVDWSRVHIFWGDERFLPTNHPDRNEVQATDALLSHVPIDPANVHRMPADEGEYQNNPHAAAQAYADTLSALADSPGGLPRFDVHLLGMGPDGHINSLFPHTPATLVRDAYVVAVTDSPKPPPQRITLTFPAVQHSGEVWVLVAGESKADAVAAAIGGAEPPDIPAAGARGSDRTAWFLDTAAAGALQ
ncbi:6-phosphogluconolactonase [Hoyosella rhizosphaerae]|uniref:6-phosphogluconolactonase n=1 Tax=Hoyosella rhizosphaerae TaxID=1755582 RepID=A0A916U3I7_9ACTN|nr:6-phosphogluconolactonase [Hoyosella rhizosphaerae]MBN4926490.1 6-phosphogluconolactonase [Hoyosella rhizosphaerae]GGC58962.1 6-phosphogluconolactonase [Hoyosella rhizosphaerae]